MALGTDPTKVDTDGDTLGDKEEVFSYSSDPLDVDTDKDGLRDGVEVSQYHTSPTLADTDGDGATDDEEVHTTGFNPLIAELPKLDISISTAPSLALNATITGTTTANNYTAVLQSRSEAVSKGASSSTEATKSNSKTVSAELEASYFPPGASGSVSATANWSESTTNTHSSSWSADSTAGAQSEYNRSVTEQSTTTFSNGNIKAGFSIINSGERAVNVTNLKIAVLKHNVFNYSAEPQLIAELVPRDGTATSFQLANGSSKGPLLAEDNTIPAQTMQKLLADPRGLEFVVYSFDFADPQLTSTLNYTQIAQNTDARTALVIIDYGDGRVTKKMVATSARRDAKGNSAGLKMSEVLGIMNVSCVTEQRTLLGIPVGNKVLKQVDNVAAVNTSPTKGFWLVVSSSPDAVDPTVNFEDITVRSRDIIRLIYVLDSDGDGLIDRDEMLYGTDIHNPDTDGDGISDGDEVRNGTDPLGVVSLASPLNLTGDVLTLAGNGTGAIVDGKDQVTLASGAFEFRALASGEIYAQTSVVNSLKYANNAIYFTDVNTIRKVDLLTGDVTTIAGSGTAGCVDGTGTAATFHGLNDIEIDSHFIYVADSVCNEIRKIALDTHEVSTLVSFPGFSGALAIDGPNGITKITLPFGMVQAGNYLFVTDLSQRIRKVNKTSGYVSTLAGSQDTNGYADGAGVTAKFAVPYGIASDGIYLYVTESGGNRIRKIRIDTGFVTTLAGDMTAVLPLGAIVDGNVGSQVKFNQPGKLYYDGRVLWLTENSSNAIRTVDPLTGASRTVAGIPDVADFAEGTAALFSNPWGLTSDGRYLYIGDLGNKRMRIMR